MRLTRDQYDEFVRIVLKEKRVLKVLKELEHDSLPTGELNRRISHAKGIYDIKRAAELGLIERVSVTVEVGQPRQLNRLTPRGKLFLILANKYAKWVS